MLFSKINNEQLSKQGSLIVEVITSFKLWPYFLWPHLGSVDSYRVE